ncbi:hypothetical protein AAHA92_17363 [Salvia divinorum]|uniref:Uncharacterized protein n=1 Tax=Salvia divinorum TaxID=28513 RepID=A0ABD1H1N9_SALDI
MADPHVEDDVAQQKEAMDEEGHVSPADMNEVDRPALEGKCDEMRAGMVSNLVGIFNRNFAGHQSKFAISGEEDCTYDRLEAQSLQSSGEEEQVKKIECNKRIRTPRERNQWRTSLREDNQQMAPEY